MVLPEGVEVVDYSDRSFVLYGNTKPIKEQLKELGGRFNMYLRAANGLTFAGWVFPITKKRRSVGGTRNMIKLLVPKVELACILAEDATLKDFANEFDAVYQTDEGDVLIYTDEAQDVFNRHYDYFLSKIDEFSS